MVTQLTEASILERGIWDPGVGDPLCLGMFLGGGGRGVQRRGDSFLTGMSKKRRAEVERPTTREQVGPPVNTPENFSGGKIASFFDVWKNFTSDQWVLNQVKGVKVIFNQEDINLKDRN